MNQELLNYVRENINKGYGREAIFNSLLEKGWNPKDVNKVFESLGSLPDQNSGTVLQTSLPSTFLYQGFWIRLTALFLDSVFLGILFFVLAVVFGLWSESVSKQYQEQISLLFLIVSLVSFIFYYIGTVIIFGTTAGKKAVGIKIVDEEGNKPSFGRVLMRETIGKIISGIFFDLGYLWVAFDSKKQAWHDKLAGTFVVKN